MRMTGHMVVSAIIRIACRLRTVMMFIRNHRAGIVMMMMLVRRDRRCPMRERMCVSRARGCRQCQCDKGHADQAGKEAA